MTDRAERTFRIPSIHDRASVEAFADETHERVWLHVDQQLRRCASDPPETHAVDQPMTRESWRTVVGILIAAGAKLGWLALPEGEALAELDYRPGTYL